MSRHKSKICPLPWVHLSTEPNAKVRPCCIHQSEVRSEQGKAFKATDTSLDEIFKSEYMVKLRQAFRNGEKPSACHMCWNDELNGKESKRELNIRSMELTDEDLVKLALTEPENPSYLQIILTNQCNLKCRTCNPVASSKWITEAQYRGLIKYEFSHNEEIYNDESEFKKSRFNWFKNLEYLELMGGEPFLHKDLEKMLDELIQLNFAPKIKVFVSTNGTIFPDNILKKCRGQFRFFGINLSIDGTGEQFEYMRHGARWESVKQNILKYYQNSLGPTGERCFEHTVGAQMTISWMNIWSAPSVFDFFTEECPKLERAFNIVYYPEEFNPVHLPQSAKISLRQHFEKFKNKPYWSDLESILRHVESHQGDEFSMKAGLIAIMDGDQYRKESYKKVYPEMYANLEHLWRQVSENYLSLKSEAFKKGFLMIDSTVRSKDLSL